METATTRGFAGISPERRRELASKGGRAAHRKGTGRQWTAEQARAAAMIAVNNKRARAAKAAQAV